MLKELGNVAAIVYIFQLYSVGEGVLKYTFYCIYIYTSILRYGVELLCAYILRIIVLSQYSQLDSDCLIKTQGFANFERMYKA